jgi:hypothetical protein
MFRRTLRRYISGRPLCRPPRVAGAARWPAHRAVVLPRSGENDSEEPTTQAASEFMIDDLKKTLWATADKLRANMDAAEYKHLVLGLIFLKYISDTFQAPED